MNLKNKRIIGFAGRKRSGKTEICKYLKNEENAIIITIANYLKRLCCDLLNVELDELNDLKNNNKNINLKYDKRFYNLIHKQTSIPINDIEDTLKDIKITNVREMLQIIGTDLIRKFNPTWHVDNMINDINSFSDDKLIVIDDVRFKNEVDAIKNIGGDVYFLIRPNYLDVSNHESEISLKWQNFDDKHVIINDTTIEKLCALFLLAYRNNFETKLNNGIFLYENLWCKNYHSDLNLNFPNTCYDKDFFKDDFIKQLKNSFRFKTNGIIIYIPSQYKFSKEFNKFLFNKDEFEYSYTLYNTLIIENLKLFL